ncbi:hypothetical protein MATL_G00219990 [Megalops atlanticus]|uniref:Fibrinogen C-terminal domain-containing protein n=1 Tax=Megalops atlanticus TaxID=7932 RepID=A0A9D3PJZ0_MEGAT|nr:hypothetical protein MATL_G00219990 [Megalops atlanticus]
MKLLQAPLMAVLLALPAVLHPPSSVPLDCADVYSSGMGRSGVYTIYPAGPTSPVQVFCDMGCEEDSDGGRWTVIQRRMDGSVNFYRGWDQYKRGFGTASGEYWLGLETIHLLTQQKSYELRVDMQDFEGGKVHAQYSSFSIQSESEGYKLLVTGFTDGGAGDSLTYHSGHKFSTFDRDQDAAPENCARSYDGAFWYNSCHYANPNGLYAWGKDSKNAVGINWYHWKAYEYSLKSIKMKIRPVGMGQSQ